ncbi:phosphatidylglycerophosphatase A [bacterium]|nr:phosphatidylglycerophosphatase A [bacterium]MBU1153898.1 phosphatidylglycerophosphatase A [bacterium]MBU1781974.1 phosphatidylglycerophosphatase A [bacterium]MBU2599731.1 phosphatidylglycerophosphatase A [bacterium]
MGFKIARSFIIYLASLSFVGYFPFFPGTLGTLLALLAYLYLSKVTLSVFWYGLILVSLILIGVLICHLAEKFLSEKDPPQIILDEFLGYLVAVFLIPFDLRNIVASFLLFRFLDISKPFFIKKLQNISGGIGILADDLAAGIITNLILRLSQLLEKLIK